VGDIFKIRVSQLVDYAKLCDGKAKFSSLGLPTAQSQVVRSVVMCRILDVLDCTVEMHLDPRGNARAMPLDLRGNARAMPGQREFCKIRIQNSQVSPISVFAARASLRAGCCGAAISRPGGEDLRES
jgi:hypothetical protein